MTDREILIEAKALIEKNGWWNGRTYPEEDTSQCHCAATAIWEITGSIEHKESYSALMLLMGALDIPIEFEKEYLVTSPIFDWNDNATAETVLAAFDRAIELAA